MIVGTSRVEQMGCYVLRWSLNASLKTLPLNEVRPFVFGWRGVVLPLWMIMDDDVGCNDYWMMTSCTDYHFINGR
eukprot:scaffold2263_cov76-Skeletonema_dohrnii-CCMP3373.AAC.5